MLLYGHYGSTALVYKGRGTNALVTSRPAGKVAGDMRATVRRGGSGTCDWACIFLPRFDQDSTSTQSPR